MPHLKICGTRHERDMHVLSACRHLLDYIGFIFTPISQRQVAASDVKRWLDQFPELREKGVAVFLDQNREEISGILAKTGLGIVQLHGEESPRFCEEIRQLPTRPAVWKMIPIREQTAGESELNGTLRQIEAYLPVVDVILLDTKIKNRPAGGTGKQFEWRLIPAIYQFIQGYNQRSGRHVQLFVAGGITPDNVRDLMAKGHFDGIDLAGGAEVNGCKDRVRIEVISNEVKHGVENR